MNSNKYRSKDGKPVLCNGCEARHCPWSVCKTSIKTLETYTIEQVTPTSVTKRVKASWSYLFSNIYIFSKLEINS